MTRLSKTSLSLLFAASPLLAAPPATMPADALQSDSPPIAHIASTEQSSTLIRSAHSGNWSEPGTWQGNKVPGANAQVLIRPNDRVLFDVETRSALRYVHVLGTLSFATDRDTRMDVGLLLVRPGDEEVSPTDAVNLMAHGGPNSLPAVLEIGTAEQPIAADHHAIIRLTELPGMDPDVCPALVDAGGRMEIHGAPMKHTWLKLKKPATAGDRSVVLDDPVEDWRVGDHVVIVTTQKPGMFTRDGTVIPHASDQSQTENRSIAAVDGAVVTLDKPLGFDHAAERIGDVEYSGEVANLSRSVVIESANPDGSRGHAMYHHGSSGSISYAEFRHLGKENQLGRYALHFHLVGDTMRGSSIVGASIWDSANRWITLHGTDYMVVRDCVGYQSVGHGFFLEDASETHNVFDHNLAVQAMHGRPLPKQILASDKNDGAGFWWANSLNTFVNNVAAECDQHGFRFEGDDTPGASNVHELRNGDGTTRSVDARTLPFIRFENNEAHSMRRFCLNLGGFALIGSTSDFKYSSDGSRSGINVATSNVGDVSGVGPDNHHPFVVKNFRAWASHWALHSASPSVLVDGLDAYNCNYGLWRCRVDRTEFHNLSMRKIAEFDIFNPWGGNANFGDDYTKSIKLIDDLPPATIITGVRHTGHGELVVSGTTEDNGVVTQVRVNSELARATVDNFAQWQVTLTGPVDHITAVASDSAGNVEMTPQLIPVSSTVAAASQ